MEASSEHFRVVADLSKEDAIELAQELEENLRALEHVAFSTSRAPVDPSTVVVFTEESDFHAFTPASFDGVFRQGLPFDLEPSRFLLLHGKLSLQSRITCMHELTHDLFERNFGAAPPWLHEGWAEYYSTIELEPDRVRVGLGLPRLTFTEESQIVGHIASDGTQVTAMPIALVAPPSELLGLDRDAFYRDAMSAKPSQDENLHEASLYIGAWALVHMLHDGPEPYPTRFKRFMDEVRNDRVEPAWERAFAGLSSADFDRDFRHYLGERKLATFEYGRPKAELSNPITTHTLSDAEVRVLWARLSSLDGESGAAAERDLDEAVREAATSPDTHYFRGAFLLKKEHFDEAESELSQAVSLAPSEPRYLHGLLSLRIAQLPKNPHLHAGDPVVELAARLARVARSAVEFYSLALVSFDSGDRSAALGFAERAVQLDPIDSRLLDGKAQVLAGLGRFQQAAETERSALAFLPDGESAPQYGKRLKTYERRAREQEH